MSSVNDKPSIETRQDSTTDNALSSEELKKREAFVRLLESWREEEGRTRANRNAEAFTTILS